MSFLLFGPGEHRNKEGPIYEGTRTYYYNIPGNHHTHTTEQTEQLEIAASRLQTSHPLIRVLLHSFLLFDV
jgi:hypothetical protein